MKSNNILERKYELKIGKNDSDLSMRINTIFFEIFKEYEKLSEDSINNIRNFIYTYFSKLRPTQYKEKKYKEELDYLLCSDIYFVGLAHYYSDNGYIQYSFLLRVYDEIKKEINKTVKIKK